MIFSWDFTTRIFYPIYFQKKSMFIKNIDLFMAEIIAYF